MKSLLPTILKLDRDAGYMVADPARVAWELLPEDVEELQLDEGNGVEKIYNPEGPDDNANAMVYGGGTGNCCRGPIATIFFKKCSWFDPRPHENWADCPL